MSFISRVFSSFVLALLSTFLLSTSFAFAGAVEKSTFIIPPAFLASCIEDIQCEQVGEKLYDCRIDGGITTDRAISVQNLSLGKVDPSLLPKRCIWNVRDISVTVPKKSLAYREPDPFIYPFVRIIKIQV